jgi:hypothetical protein
MFSDCATSQRRGELAQANKRQRLHPNGVVHYVMGKAVRPSRVFKPTDGPGRESMLLSGAVVHAPQVILHLA